WGEALGMHGLAFAVGSAVGPAIGSYIAKDYGIDFMFYCSSAFALLSILIVIRMGETLADKHAFSWSMLRINRSEIIEWRAIPAGIVTLLSYSGYGVILTLIPDWSDHLGIGNKGLFFTAYTLASISIRFLSGKVSDRYGRIRVMYVGIVIISISLLLLGLNDSIEGLIWGAIVYGVGGGILSPAVNAWTIDLSLPQHRGQAIAAMYIALEIGIGGGVLLGGYIYRDEISNIPFIFILNSVIIFLAFFYVLQWDIKNKRSR